METVVMLVPMIVILGGFMWYMSRQDKKKETTQRTFVDSLKPGDKVITAFGLYGIIDSIDKDTCVLRMLDGKSMLRVDKRAIDKKQPEKDK